MESFDWALTAFAEGAPFTAFDIETTGLDPKRDRIVEFGALRFDREGVIVRYSVLVNPGIPMPEEAGRVNGITDAMLAGKPPVEQVLPDFLRLVKDTVIIAHNAPFDCGFVNETLSRLYRPAPAQTQGEFHLPMDIHLPGEMLGGLDGAAPWTPPFSALPNKTADTLLMARRFFPGRSHYKLQDLARDLDIRAEAAHRALDDARLCMELFLKMGYKE